jgi:AAHS family benzoate transporter-like MFS transporter
VFTAGAGLTSDPVSFSVMRFIAGLGIGGVMPNIVAQMTEYAPRRVRSLMTTAMFSGYAFGGILAAVLGKQLIGEHGWQAVFIAAGVPVVLIPFVLKSMPESIAYLMAKQDRERLRSVALGLQPDLKLDAQVDFSVPREDRAAGAALSRLFQDGRGFSTVMFWIAFFTGLFMIYALSSWLTKLMAMSEIGRAHV